MNNTQQTSTGGSLFLELNQVRPLDILLMAGTGKDSTAIRVGAGVSRGGRVKYSHAGLFLSPALMLEASDDGIVITQLATGTHLGILDRSPDLQSLNPSLLFPRLDNGDLKVFARLKGVTDAVVLRHQDSEKWGSSLWLLREKVMQYIGYCYLTEYPAAGRLLRTADFLPPHFLDVAEAFTRRIQKKVLTGPFCSELVMACLRATGMFVSPEDSQREPEAFNPADLERLEGWTKKLVAVRASGPEKLPGDADVTFASELLSMLSLPMHTNQAFASKLRLLNALVIRCLEALELHQYPNGLPASRTSLVPDRSENHLETLSDIQRYIDVVCDPLWTWIGDANRCLRECPSARLRAGHKIRLDEPTLSERIRLPSYKVIERWDGSRCSDIRSCRGVTPRWNYLTETAQSLTNRVTEGLQSSESDQASFE